MSETLASKIDHTLLKPTLTETELTQLCSEAAQFQFASVCVPPSWVPFCVEKLKNTGVMTITVVGFPLGYSTPQSKAYEAQQAIEAGAAEIDMVINVSALKSKKWDWVEADIRAVKQACGKVPLKVIIETAYLTQAEKIQVAQLAESCGADFVKTSTGFATGVETTGATLADIQLLRNNLRPNTQIKASGGVRDFDFAQALVRAGANRLGTSSGVHLVQGKKPEAPGAY